jgi:Family of unknown function (DUF6256)
MSSLLIREDLVPMVVGYLLVMGALAVGLRIVRRDASASEPTPAPEIAAGAPQGPSPVPAPKAAAGLTQGPSPAPAATAPGQPPASEPTPSARRGPLARAGIGMLIRPGWPRLIRHLLATALGGYLVLMVVIVAYYFGVHAVHSLVQSALTGCGLLLGLSIPVFLALSWLAERRHRHQLRTARAGQG